MSDSGYVTNRGFTGYAQLTDSKGQLVRVQDSSSAEDACVWIFCEHGDTIARAIANGQLGAFEPSPHLTVDQAVAVRDALDAFIDRNSTALDLNGAEVALLVDVDDACRQRWVDLEEQRDEYPYPEFVDEVRAKLPELDDGGQLRLSDNQRFMLRRMFELAVLPWTTETSGVDLDAVMALADKLRGDEPPVS